MFTQPLRVLLLFSLVNIGAAQDIKVRLLDCRTGIAYADKAVRVGFFHPVGTPEIPDLKAQTTAEGIAVLHFSEKLPSQFIVFPGTGKDLYPCSTLAPIDLREVISKGIVSRCSKAIQGCRCKFGKAVAEVRSDPRELVIFAQVVGREPRLRVRIRAQGIDFSLDEYCGAVSFFCPRNRRTDLSTQSVLQVPSVFGRPSSSATYSPPKVCSSRFGVPLALEGSISPVVQLWSELDFATEGKR